MTFLVKTPKKKLSCFSRCFYMESPYYQPTGQTLESDGEPGPVLDCNKFSKPTLLPTFRWQPNIRSHVIRSAIAKPPDRYPKRNQWGVKKCNQNNCTSCPFIREGRNITINGTQNNMDCNSYDDVYEIFCKIENCQQEYFGETKRMLKFCLADHCGYVVNKDTTTATGKHFNLPGHCLSDLSISIIERVRQNYTIYRKEREEFHIRRFDTLHRGLNRKY